MKRIVKAVIVIATLALSLIAGLAIGRGAQAYKVYIPMTSSYLSKIGIAPGGYQAGDLDRLRAAWSYRWRGDWFSDTTPVWVDMIWSDKYLDAPIKSDTILGFNEPDLAGQADMTPEQGAIAWRWIEEHYPDKQLISPAPSQLHPDWLWEMIDRYKSAFGTLPRFDGIALHYYGIDAQAAMDLITARGADALAHGYNVPLWLTEIGTCGPDEVEYFQSMAAWIESTDWIARAAWYKLRADQYDPSPCSTLLDDAGLTPLGRAFIEAHHAF